MCNKYIAMNVIIVYIHLGSLCIIYIIIPVHYIYTMCADP